jgi:hypothetical protein
MILKEKTKKENGTNRLGTCKIENIINLINIFVQFIHLNKKKNSHVSHEFATSIYNSYNKFCMLVISLIS